MADIKLFLYVDGTGDVRQLDVKDDKQFPLSINYTAGSYKNIDVRQGSFTLEFRIPANKNNKTALNHLNDSNVQDGDNLLHNTECSIVADGFPLFKGTFKLLGTVNDRGHEEFNCKIQSGELEWAKHMQDRTLKDYTWGNIPDISKTKIENTWTNDYTDKYIYPLCHYGEWKEKNNVLASDLRPALFVRAIFKEAFESAGYTIVENDGDGHFFDSTNSAWRDNLILPYTSKAYERSEADIDAARFTANQTESQKLSWQISLSASHNFSGKLNVIDYLDGFTINNIQKRENFTITNSSVGANGTYSRAYTYYFKSGFDVNSLNFLKTNSSNYGAVLYDLAETDSTPQNPIKIVDFGIANRDITGNTNVPYVTLLADSTQNELYDAAVNIQNNNYSSNVFYRSIYFVYNETGNEKVLEYNSDTGAGAVNFKTSLDSSPNNRYIAAISTESSFDLSLKFYSYSINQGIISPILEKNTGRFKFFINQNGDTTRNNWADSLTSPSDWTGETLPSDDTVNLLSIDVESGDFDVNASDYVDTSIATHPSDFTRNSLNRIYNNKPTKAGESVVCTQYVVVSETEFESNPKRTIQNGSGSLDLSSIMSDEYTMLDYIKGYVHAFNLMIKTDPYTKTVVIKERDSFYDTMSNAYDWTNKIDTKKQYDLQYLDFYKRTMNYKFQRDGRDRHLQEVDKITDRKTGDYTDTLSERFEKGETNLTNPLFAYTYHVSDRTILAEGGSKFYMARMWNEFRPASQPPVYDNNFRPRILFNQYKSVGLKWNWEGTIENSAAIAVPDDYNGYGDLPYSLSYCNGTGKGFFERFYNKTRNTIEKGARVEIPIKLSYKDIQTLDLSRLVYFSAPAELKGYWIIDKVKNFRPSNVVTTTVELVKKEDFDQTIAEATQNVYVTELDEEISAGRGERDDWVTKGGGFVDRGQWTVEQDADKEYDFVNDKELSGLDSGLNPKEDKVREAGDIAGRGSLVLSNNKNETRGGSGNAVFGRGNRVMGSNQTVMGSYAQTNTTLNMAVGAGTSPNDRYNAFSVDRNGIVREGEGHLVTNDNGDIKQVYEEVNGELVKITL
jgi:hypothetical protein